jgi:hypothetical protein
MAYSVFRQTFTAGVVLASAGAIALTPVTITPEVKAVVDIPRAVTTEVMPAGLVQDLQLIANGARAAIGQSVDGLVRKVPDIWWTVEEQWPDAELTHWNYAMVANIVFAPITPLVIGPLNDAVAEAVARNFPALGDQIRQIPDFLEYSFIRLVGPLLSAIGAAGYAHTAIYYSTTTWRIEPFIEAIVKAPFHVIDGLLFGGFGDLGPILPGKEGQYIPAPGLLTPWGKKPPVRDIKTPEDIVTTVPDVNASVISLTTGRGEQSDGKATGSTEELTELPIADTVVEPPVVEPAVPEPVAETGAEIETESPAAKPAKRDPGAGIRQSIKEFRAHVGHTVKKLTSSGAAPRPNSPAAGDSASSAKADSAADTDSP